MIKKEPLRARDRRTSISRSRVYVRIRRPVLPFLRAAVPGTFLGFFIFSSIALCVFVVRVIVVVVVGRRSGGGDDLAAEEFAVDADLNAMMIDFLRIGGPSLVRCRV